MKKRIRTAAGLLAACLIGLPATLSAQTAVTPDGGKAKALNPQPLPPKESATLKQLNPQPLPPKALGAAKQLNPQPLPPKEKLQPTRSRPSGSGA